MKTTILALLVTALAACDMEGAEGERTWNDRSTAPIVAGPSSAQPSAEAADWTKLAPITPPPPPPATCADGYERLAYEPPTVLFCRPLPGTAENEDPCLGLRVVVRGDDGLVACE